MARLSVIIDQRVCELAVGRALMAKPKLLLLDEPSLGLAPLTMREIFQIIVEPNAEVYPSC